MENEVQYSFKNAENELNDHLIEIINWHFSEETGTPYWLNWASQHGVSLLKEVKCFADIVQVFPHFKDELLREVDHKLFIPKPYLGKPYKIFETGGTTGIPKQRISWEDHLTDYTEFSETLNDQYFPPNSDWLMLGPTGPRRLRLSIEHLANIRGGSCFFVDLDPRWVKKLIANHQSDQVKTYKQHVTEQAVAVIKNRDISCLFTTPLLLEALGEWISIPDAGIKGVFCGGTTMTPQNVRFIIEEVLENKTHFVPTYGNTLMGLACSLPLKSDDNYSITYWAPQPRAVLRVVNPDKTTDCVEYGDYGRVELTTLTKEFFMPRFLERDEAIRRHPCQQYPWDGVGDVRPFGSQTTSVIEGVY